MPPGPGDTRDEAADQLSAAWRDLMGLVLDQRWRWSEVAAELQLTQAGLRALLAVDPNRPRAMRELAQALNCDPSYVTAMVDDLEQAGLAQRQAAPADRRVKTVALTPAGRQALRRVQLDLFAPPTQFSRLTSGQRRQLAHLLELALRDPDPAARTTRPAPG
jgi:DNA-binding MarR family transcriptional regulator